MKKIAVPVWSVLPALLCVLFIVSWGMRQSHMAANWKKEREEMQKTIIEQSIKQTVSAQTPSKNCTEPNANPPSELYAYTNNEYGISFEMPYNEQWGYDKPIAPYVDLPEANAVLFGPPRPIGRNCDWAYTYQATFLPGRTKEELEAFVLENYAPQLEDGQITEEEIIVKTIKKGDRTVWTYSLPGECYGFNFELEGANHNIVFSGCGTRILRDIDAMILSVADDV